MYTPRDGLALIIAFWLLHLCSAHSNERNPLTYLTRVENSFIKAPSQRVHALSNFDLFFDLHEGKQQIKLTLSPNHDVIADGATIQYLAPDGSLRVSEPIERLDYRVFKGHAWIQNDKKTDWKNVGWARIMLRRDGKVPLFEGAFRFNGNHHHVQTRTHYMQTKHTLDPELEATEDEYMVVWRDSDVSSAIEKDEMGFLHGELKRGFEGELACSADALSFNTNPDHPVYASMLKRDTSLWGSISTRSLFGRQIDGQTGGNSAGVNLTSTIGSSAGCPTARRVALVGVATDCTYTASFNSSSTARENVISVINLASVQYENSFNISLGLANLTVMDAQCPGTAAASTPWNIGCSDSVTIQDRLNLFSGWRGQFPDNNAYWTLLSTCATGSAVGLAWLGQACVNTAQVDASNSVNETVSGANVVVRTSTEWQVIAHETGHTFGAVHDCTSETCSDGTTVQSQQCCPFSSTTCDANGAFIMNPSTGSNIQQFSACTIGNICSAIGRNSVKTTCLTANKDVNTISGSQCGNGIVESGEDCDCGGTSGCGDNTCCDPTTCKFTTNSVCDPSNEDCCTSSCNFAVNGTVCRESTGVCDPQEVCSGTTASCPADITAPDGKSCGSSLSCASGQCTSRTLQCQTIMGVYTTNNDTYACPSSGCQISCASPEFGSGVCYGMQQNFLDGTSCKDGGRCINGQCKGGSVAKAIRMWIDSHKTLVIALASVLGGLLILSIMYCCWSSHRKRNNPNARRPPPQSRQRAPMSWGGGRGQPQMRGAEMRGAQGPGPGVWDNGRWRPDAPQAWTPRPSVRYA